MSFRILGVEIERKTDVLAFAAFLISLGSLLTQTFSLIRGPEIILDGPGIITLYSGTGSDKKKKLRLAAGFTYLNKGSPGYDDFIKSEQVTVLLDDKVINLTAKYYIQMRSEGKKLQKSHQGDAIPVALKSGMVNYHETEFVPLTGKHGDKDDHVEIERFIALLNRSSNFRLTFSIETYEGTIIRKQCYLEPSKVVKGLKDEEKIVVEIGLNNKESSNRQGWSATSCRYNSDLS